MRSHGMEWTEDRVAALVAAKSSGFTAPECAAILSKEWGHNVTTSMVNNTIYKHSLMPYLMEIDNAVAVFDEEIYVKTDAAIVTSDWHAPHHNEVWVNRMLNYAHKYGIKTHIIGGDWFDMDFAKWSKFKSMTKLGEGDSTLDLEIDKNRQVIEACKYFDETYLICGNHEQRVDRLTDGKIQARHIIDLMGGNEMEGLTVSVYDKLFINDDIVVTHPGSYSQISGSVAVRLAEKFHRHVLNAHGHFLAMRYNRSADYMCCDIGGMFDTKKIDYICKKTTTHPTWNNGFAVVMDGDLELVHEGNLGFWGLK